MNRKQALYLAGCTRISNSLQQHFAADWVGSGKRSRENTVTSLLPSSQITSRHFVIGRDRLRCKRLLVQPHILLFPVFTFRRLTLPRTLFKPQTKMLIHFPKTSSVFP